MRWGLLLFWLFGLAWVCFPRRVYRLYAWWLGSSFTTRNEPRHIRRAGIVWLILMTVFTCAEWFR